jgi:hypothetical protein
MFPGGKSTETNLAAAIKESHRCFDSFFMIQEWIFDNYLDLLEAVDRYYEERGALAVLRGWGAVLAQDFDGGIHLFSFQANQQSGHAAPQQTPGGGDACNAEIGRGEALGDGVGIGIAHDGKDKFHG